MKGRRGEQREGRTRTEKNAADNETRRDEAPKQCINTNAHELEVSVRAILINEIA